MHAFAFALTRMVSRSIFASEALQTTTMGFSQAIAVRVEEGIFLGRNGNWHTYKSDSMNRCRPDPDNLMTSDVMTGDDIFEEGKTPA